MNAGPVTAAVTGFVLLTDVPQPAASREAAVSVRVQSNDLRWNFERTEGDKIEEGKRDIGHFAFCVLRNFF
jgi:hypothetical protein